MNVRGFPSSFRYSVEEMEGGGETKEETAPATGLDGPPWPHVIWKTASHLYHFLNSLMQPMCDETHTIKK